MTNVTECFLVRHADSPYDVGIPEPAMPLSVAGKQQAAELCGIFSGRGIQRIFSSSHLRSTDTVAPLARILGLPVEIREDLRSRFLSHTYVANWPDVLKASWEDFDYRLADGESNRMCQDRIRSCLLGIMRECAGMKILVGSHGNAIALLLNSIDPGFRHKQWEEMRNPHIYRLLWDGASLIWDRAFKA